MDETKTATAIGASANSTEVVRCLTPVFLAGECGRALGRPIWAIQQTGQTTCPRDSRAIDFDGDDLPDGCDSCQDGRLRSCFGAGLAPATSR